MELKKLTTEKKLMEELKNLAAEKDVIFRELTRLKKLYSRSICPLCHSRIDRRGNEQKHDALLNKNAELEHKITCNERVTRNIKNEQKIRDEKNGNIR